MKQHTFLFCIVIILFMALPFSSHAQFFKKLKEKADAAINNKPATTDKTATSENKDTPSEPSKGLEAYQNYDFIPGDKIVFEDNFGEDQLGEFPSHWYLINGQATLNNVGDTRALFFTASATRVSPLMKNPVYLKDSFTVEFDHYAEKGYGPKLLFYQTDADADGNDKEIAYMDFCSSNAWIQLYTKVMTGQEKSAVLPDAIHGDNYYNKWHHYAIAYKSKRLKIYIDQYRVVSLPDFNVSPKSIAFRADGAPSAPIVIANIRIANGAGMINVDQKFTDDKIVTHINFDVDKASIKPESMGTLNGILEILKNNPDLKFDIQGHTDNKGDATHNLTLSGSRASAVKQQLVKMGIPENRLTTNGFGDTKPIADNTNPEGRANNRRVEFVTVK